MSHRETEAMAGRAVHPPIHKEDDVSIRGTGKTFIRASVHIGRWDLSLLIKWPEQEADLSPPSSAEAESGAAPPLPYTLSLRGQGLQSSPHSSFIWSPSSYISSCSIQANISLDIILLSTPGFRNCFYCLEFSTVWCTFLFPPCLLLPFSSLLLGSEPCATILILQFTWSRLSSVSSAVWRCRVRCHGNERVASAVRWRSVEWRHSDWGDVLHVTSEELGWSRGGAVSWRTAYHTAIRYRYGYKLTVVQPVINCCAFNGTRSFVSVFINSPPDESSPLCHRFVRLPLILHWYGINRVFVNASNKPRNKL